MVNTNTIGENQINPQVMGQVTPDVVSPQGKQQLYAKLAQATVKKPELDKSLKSLAEKIGAKFTSRIKNSQTVVQKIAQKRLQGRAYGIEDVNDAYGGRLIVDNKKEIAKAKNGIKELAEKGLLKIRKEEPVKTGTYAAYHYDIKTPDGVKGEIQIMTPQQALESIANHGLRSQFGEKPQGKVAELRDKQAELAKKISSQKAKEKYEKLSEISKQFGNTPPDPRMVASIMQT